MNVITRKRHESVSIRFSFSLDMIPGDYFVSLGVALDDAHRDNLAIDRRYDLIHLCVIGEYGDFGIADLKMKIEELPAGFGEPATNINNGNGYSEEQVLI
jgi:lipopolysaccharide transport system ATP-binding protein